MTAEHLRREVVTHPAVFQPYNRPFVIVGEQANPAFSDQYIALGISTVDAPDAIRLTERDWEVGGLSRESFVNPWYPTVISADNVVTEVGALSADIVDTAVTSLAATIGVESA